MTTAARILTALGPGPLDFVGLLVALKASSKQVNSINAALGKLIEAGAVTVDRGGPGYAVAGHAL
jgi:hypothetical protein